MSWQLGAFSILGLALIAGFGWYERSRPDARVVALVATLAALAAIGRIAFAAVPNVKPTTDIVLISGYALGGAPGFAVGATAGLSSNFFFGQGPWTPWQMAGWGVVGMIGAGLALLTRRRISRWPLAVACGVVGFAFAALQDVGDWVTFSDHSVAQLGVYVGKGVAFDLIHAGSCVLFALAFGRALTSSIERFAVRLQVDWGPALLGALLVTCTAAAALSSGWLATQAASAGGSPTQYLLSAQNSDGGFGPAPGQGSSALYSGWAALGLEAEGHNPADVRHGGASLLSYIEHGAGAGDPGSLERTILVLSAAGSSPGMTVGRLERTFRPDGSVGDQVNLTSFAILALRAAGTAPPPRMLSWLSRQQDRDGGFNFARKGAFSDVDDTGAALQALASAGGVAAHARARAVSFIARQQDRDGGFPSEPGEASNAQSTAWAVQGLQAAGADPSSLHRAGAPSPLEYLQSLTAPDGHIRYSRSSDQTPVWVTGQALMALAGKPLPLAAVARTHAVRHRRRHARSHARVPHRARSHAARHARRAHRRRHVQRASSPLSQLAADAACAAALALGPVGLA